MTMRGDEKGFGRLWAPTLVPSRAVPPNRDAPRDAAAVRQALDTRRRRAEMLAQGMDADAVEAVFEQEYDARRAAR